MSVIVPALLGYHTVLAALDAWEAQTCRDQLEILILCPHPPEAGLLRPGQIVIATGTMGLHSARSAGIHQARADYVLLAEDHCLPDKLCAEAMLGRLAEGWDAVGPALRSGNPRTNWSQAPFLLGYGQWLAPAGGPARVLPGHNAVIRKNALLELGPALEQELLVASFLLRRLHAQGQRFYVEDQATMRHYDAPGRAREMRMFCCVGLGFGALRTKRWPWAARALYWLFTPLIAARHWERAFIQYRRAGAQSGLSPWCLGAAAMLALAWACGESAGAIMGVDRVTPLIWFSEIKPLARSDV